MDDCCEPPTPEVVAAGDQKIANAIREVLDERFPQHGPHMVLNWHVCATIMSNDGERYVWPVAPDDSRSWEIMGMLDHAMALQNAYIIKQRLQEED